MVSRRTILKNGMAAGATGITGLLAADSVTAADSPLVLNRFEDAQIPGPNALGEWTGAYAFTNGEGSGELVDGALRLSYDDAGFFASKVFRDVTPNGYLVMSVRGDEGGEEEHVQFEAGRVEVPLSTVTDDAIGTSFAPVAVDLDAMGVDRTAVDDVRLNFWQGHSGAIEIDWIAFADSPRPTLPSQNGENENEDDERGDPGDTFPWEVQAGNEKEPAAENTLAASAITGETTVAELCPTFDSRENNMFVDRVFTEYPPSETADPGDVDITETNLSDGEKAAMYDVDLDAIQRKIQSGDVTMDELGTQALDHVTTYVEAGFPYHATAQLLPRIMLLPDEPERMPYHKGGNPWDETAGPTTPTNDPDQFVQYEWPTDARSYRDDRVYERDRAHDQKVHEPENNPDVEWTSGTPGEEVYADENHPLLDAIEEHPVTGADLSGGFTSNARIEAAAEVHSDNGDYLYQLLQFKNVQQVPYYVDAAVIWWVGPSSLSTLRNGHYNNAQRPNPGVGHPQRDIIEVIYDRERALSAYAIRIAQHDEPYNMRTAYPNQYWSLEQGLPAADPINGGERFSSAEERQTIVDTMLSTLHVEFEANLDRNQQLVDALELRNRVSN